MNYKTVIFFLVHLISYSSGHSNHQRLLLISLNGFRHDFIQTYNLANLNKLQKLGASSVYLNPEFPTASLPNQWSLATGVHTQTHGIIADNFYEPSFHEHFKTHKNDLKWWNSSSPIWYSAVRQNIKTGVFSWPGSDVSFENQTRLPDYKLNLLYQVSGLQNKIDASLRLILKEDYRFISIYHEQPGQIAEKYGIDSAEFNVTLKQLDEDIGYLMDRLEENRLLNSRNFNTILVSPHGMVNIRQIVFLNEFILESDAEIWSFSATLIHLRPLIDLNEILMKLARVPGASITLKSNLPDRLNYKNNIRVGDVIITAVEGVIFMFMNSKPFQISNNGQVSYFRLSYNQKKQLMIASADRAACGYDNLYPNMRGLFIANGALFKNNFISKKPIKSIDVYPLICYVLNIYCEKRNGRLEDSEELLKKPIQYSSKGRSFTNNFLFSGCTARPRLEIEFSVMALGLVWLFSFIGEY